MMPKKDNIRKDLEAKGAAYFNKNYAQETKRNYVRRLRRQYILDGLKDVPEGVRVLDMGCGPEILFPLLLEKASEYVAVDLASSNLEEIRKKNQDDKLVLVEGDMDSFYWQQDYFDVIVCSGVIEYTNDPEKNLGQMIASLKKGGLLICSFPSGTSPYRIWSEYVYRHIWKLKNKLIRKQYFYYPRRLFSKKKIVKSIHDAFRPECLSVQYFGHKFIMQPLDVMLGMIDYGLMRFFCRHPFRWLDFFCVEFLLRLKK